VTHVLAIDVSDTGGVLIPLAIITGCVVVSVIAIVVRHRRARRADDEAFAQEEAVRATQAPPGADWGAGGTDLLQWQQSQGQHVDRWLNAHEGTLPALVPGADPAIDAQLDEAMANAASVCPNPEVSTLLHGMRSAARATREAVTGGDHEAANAAHERYARDRAGAIAAMSPSAGATPDVGA
jgi:hypothetical protein